MTFATEKINQEKARFEFDGEDCIIETTTGQVVYSETGSGEIDLRNVMRGAVMWENTTDPFTFDDFVSEIVIPDLIASGILV